MANLDNLIRWQAYAPDLGGNRELAKPFTVLLAVGLTKPDMQRLSEAIEALPKTPEPSAEQPLVDHAAYLEARADGIAHALGAFVRLGPEPLTVGGEPIDTLAKLLRLYARIASGPVALLELVSALRYFNSAGGTAQLFFERLSGGSVSTEQTSRAAR